MTDYTEEIPVPEIEEENLPDIIAQQIDTIGRLNGTVQKALEAAEDAKGKADAARIPVGMFKKKAAIELLQDVADGLADAQISAAEAQKLSFQYHRELTNVCKYLFGLGTSNIAMNRSVVKELELKLKAASEEEISDIAREELKNVIVQLKAQEDVMVKQEFLANKVRGHETRIGDAESRMENVERTCAEQEEKLVENSKKVTEHGETLKVQMQKTAEQERKLEVMRNAEDDLNKRMQGNESKISELEKDIEKVTRELYLLRSETGEKNVEFAGEIEALKKAIGKTKYTVIKNILFWIVSAIAAVSLILNILHFIGKI